LSALSGLGTGTALAAETSAEAGGAEQQVI